jgi:hypothetical protein
MRSLSGIKPIDGDFDYKYQLHIATQRQKQDELNRLFNDDSSYHIGQYRISTEGQLEVYTVNGWMKT